MAHRLSSFACCVVSVVVLATAALTGHAPDSRIRVLIVDGYSNHDWQLTTRQIRGILEPTGLFAVTVSTAPPTGTGQDTGHDARLDTVVRRLGDHPIHAGLPRAWMTPDIEVYHYVGQLRPPTPTRRSAGG